MDLQEFEERVARIMQVVKSTTGEAGRVSVSFDDVAGGTWVASVEILRKGKVYRVDQADIKLEWALNSLERVVNSFPFRMKVLAGGIHG